MIRALLLDLDDTLYDYPPCEAAGRTRLAELAAAHWGVPHDTFGVAYDRARAAVKSRCAGPSGHSRLLYVHDLVHRLAFERGAKPSLHVTRELERAFWDAYLDAARLRPGAVELLRRFRGAQGKIAIVTDLTLGVQLEKLEKLGLFDHVDALVASEEVGFDKPHRAPFELASTRLDVPLGDCAVIGDNPDKDGAGAEALGIPFFLVRTQESPRGLTLSEIEQELARRNRWTS